VSVEGASPSLQRSFAPLTTSFAIPAKVDGAGGARNP
jgi:hypothetical protein